MRLLARERLAGAPITWGVCEIPDWGTILPARRVLHEIASLGLAGTELGPVGYLPSDPADLRTLLDEHGLRLVGGFVPLVLHRAERAGEAIAEAATIAGRLAAAGGEVLVSAADTGAPDLSSRPALSEDEWRHLFAMLARIDAVAGERGLRHAFHPHVGTVVETRQEVRRVLDASTVALCLDTGHLTIGGTDPAAVAREAADRIGHVHLKDVDLRVAEGVRESSSGFKQAVQQGLFRPLGNGGVAVAQVIAALEGAGYRGWYVLEQDAVLGADPAESERPMANARTSLAYLEREVLA